MMFTDTLLPFPEIHSKEEIRIIQIFIIIASFILKAAKKVGGNNLSGQ